MSETPSASPLNASSTSPGKHGAGQPLGQASGTVPGDRLLFLDFLRAISSHMIVWHHLVFYGPLSDVAEPLWPTIQYALYQHGRNAVQVFFVMGGFVTVLGLQNRPLSSLADALSWTWHRYLRIGGPYLVLLVIAVVANLTADAWMDHESISQFPSLPQFLAHTVLIHDVLGYEALSAGIWYLAIDFQLGLLAVCISLFSQRLASLTRISAFFWTQLFLWPLAGASLFYFNRDAQFEPWAVFFFGSYALGMMTAWAVSRRLPAGMFWLFLGLVVAALWFDFRPRLAVATGTALLIFIVNQFGLLTAWPRSRLIQFAAASSYSLFLIHFPVCLVTNAVLSNFVLHSRALCLAGMVAGYVLSLIAATVFYFAVEKQFLRWSRPATNSARPS